MRSLSMVPRTRPRPRLRASTPWRRGLAVARVALASTACAPEDAGNVDEGDPEASWSVEPILPSSCTSWVQTPRFDRVHNTYRARGGVTCSVAKFMKVDGCVEWLGSPGQWTTLACTRESPHTSQSFTATRYTYDPPCAASRIRTRRYAVSRAGVLGAEPRLPAARCATVCSGPKFPRADRRARASSTNPRMRRT